MSITNKLYNIKTYSLILYVFSLPYDNWDPFGISNFFTVAKMAGLLYLLFSLFDIRNNFNFKFVKEPIIPLLTIWLLMFIQSVAHDKYEASSSVINFSFFQNIIMFWLISNDLIRNKKTARYLMLSLISGVFIMASLSSFGIGMDTNIDAEFGTYRLSFFGSNPNSVGNFGAVALFFALHMIISRRRYYGKKTLLLLLTIPSLLTLISLSGSRGALLITLIGIIFLFIFHKEKISKKIWIISIGVFFLMLSIPVLLESDMMKKRVETTTTEGSLGGRDQIWKHALDIFYENPLLGVGSTGYKFKIMEKSNSYVDTHNIFLYFMVTTGIVGLFLYLLFIYQLALSSFRLYKYQKEVFILVLLIIYLFLVFKAGGALNSKLYWLMAAIIYGTGITSNIKYLRKRKE